MSKSSRQRLMRRLTTKAKLRDRRPTQRRACDGCTACCWALAVRDEAERDMMAMDKPGAVACEHSGAGCAVYEIRPRGCRDYLCAWALGVLELGQDMRPDKCGLVIDVGPATVVDQTDEGMRSRLVPDAVHLRPLDPDALARLPLLIQRLAKSRTCVVMVGEKIVGLLQPGDMIE